MRSQPGTGWWSELNVSFSAGYRQYLLEVRSGGVVRRLERGAQGWW
ncbi:hypothetical protein J7E96_02135 [Streptomyces sp. ISL-96]|nr:hypothetical protein [Streptomyces sp. ISL-96]MBT2487357.1 hypothetical protein [Streptomyces sp. ISL-96]